MRKLSQEQNEEIIQCFNLFDRDGNGSIDTKELKDAMKALGIFLKKQELKEYMSKMDKDGSGSVEQVEFICLMTEVLNKRNIREELRKVFHCYDNDDDGKINTLNLFQCAQVLDMADEVNQANLEMMIEIGDPDQKGYVDRNDFDRLVVELGLVPEGSGDAQGNDYERACKDAELQIQ